MKTLVGGLLVLGVIVGGFFWLNGYIYQEKQAVVAADYRDAEYVIEGERVKLEDGMAESEVAQGSASMMRTHYFGNEAKGDLNGDGIEDVVFLLTQESGGSGVFYYVAAALKSADDTYTGTNAILLGDRIAPQSTEIRGAQIIVNFGDRPAGAPMTEQPSVGVSRFFRVENSTLVLDNGVIEWLIEESGVVAESGAPLTSVGIRAHGQQRAIGTFEGSCMIIDESGWGLQPGEKTGVICWFAGGGTEIGAFEEGESLVIKKASVDEGSAEEPGTRGAFEALFMLE